MAIRKEVVENKIAVEYHGITVYHTHEKDDYYNPPNKYVFSLDPFGAESDVDNGTVFDVRKLQCYKSSLNTYQNLLLAIDEGLLGETNITQREAGISEYVSVDGDADEDHCPVCNAYLPRKGNDVWGNNGLIDDGTSYEFNCRCPQCGASFKQIFRLEFDGCDID